MVVYESKSKMLEGLEGKGPPHKPFFKVSSTLRTVFAGIALNFVG